MTRLPIDLPGLLLIGLLSVGCGEVSQQSAVQSPSTAGRYLLDEFTDPKHLVLVLPAEDDAHCSTFDSILESVEPTVTVTLMRQETLSAKHHASSSAFTGNTLQINHDSRWVRDFLPWELETEAGRFLLKTEYLPIAPLRPYDDRAPYSLADALATPLLSVPLVMDGGSFITNGEGLAVVSTIVEQQNGFWGYSRNDIEEILRVYFGVTKCLFVEPLAGEATGHVDMFATFLAKDRLLLGSYRPAVDSVNAARLDHIGKEASRLTYDGRPLQIERIDMPHHADGIWRTFTNVLFVGSQVLVPTYEELGSASDAAIARLQELSPTRKVIGIDCSKIAERGGALHCISRCYSSASTEGPRDESPPNLQSDADSSWSSSEIVRGLQSHRADTMFAISTEHDPPVKQLLEVLTCTPKHSDDIRRDAAFLLRQARAELKEESYKQLLEDSNFHVRWFTMAMIGDHDSVDLLQSLRDKVPDRIISFCLRLNPRNAARMISFLESGLVHRDPQIRIWTVETLVELASDHPQLLPAVKQFAGRERDENVRAVCKKLDLLDE